MSTAIIAQVILHQGNVRHGFPAPLVLAIQNPEGVDLKPLPAILAQLTRPVRNVLEEILPVSLSAFRAPDGVDIQCGACKAQFLRYPHPKEDHFRI